MTKPLTPRQKIDKAFGLMLAALEPGGEAIIHHVGGAEAMAELVGQAMEEALEADRQQAIRAIETAIYEALDASDQVRAREISELARCTPQFASEVAESFGFSTFTGASRPGSKVMVTWISM